MARKHLFNLALVGLLALLGAASAGAETVPLDLTIGAGGDTLVFDDLQGVVSGDAFSTSGGVSDANYAIEWLIEGDADPFVSFALGVTNLAAVPTSFAFLFATPIVPTGPPSVTSGTVGVTLTDNDGDGAVIDGPGSIYEAQVNGVAFHTLWDDPFTFTNPVPFTSAVTDTSFGLPGPSFPGPAVTATTLGLLIQFTLSPQDSASLTGNFVLNEAPVVPEPATLSLIGLGLAAMGARKLRRAK